MRTIRVPARGPVLDTIALIDRWTKAGYETDEPILLGAVAAIDAYQRRLKALTNAPGSGDVVAEFLDDWFEAGGGMGSSTPYPYPMDLQPGEAFEAISRLANARRSVRNYGPKSVPQKTIEAAVRVAQESPSACNRQPCRVRVVESEERRIELLSFQNGNRGFGHQCPQIMIISADERAFFDASERHEPYIDGGLFAMSLLLALRAQGVASCCLNWCVTPQVDKEVHRRFGIPDAERIVMLMAIGYPETDVDVPRSPKRKLEDVLSWYS